MIKSVTIQEFDTDVLKVGNFITYCDTRKTYKDAFRNETEIVNGRIINGIISHVGKDYINIVNIGNPARITVENILKDEKRILGILENVIEPEPTIPDEPIIPEDETVVTPPEGTIPDETGTDGDTTPPEGETGETVVTPPEDETDEGETNVVTPPEGTDLP